MITHCISIGYRYVVGVQIVVSEITSVPSIFTVANMISNLLILIRDRRTLSGEFSSLMCIGACFSEILLYINAVIE